MSKNAFWSIVAVIMIIAAGYFAVTRNLFTVKPSAPVVATTTQATTTPAVISTANYTCDEGKTIAASYTQSSVALSFSDGRALNLPQTVSGSGIRYEGTVGSSTDLVFWSEGANAFVTENGTSTFQDCLAGTVTAGAGSNSFADQAKTFSFSYPSGIFVTSGGGGYTQSWMVNATTSGMILAQIKVPASYVPGTNFADATFRIGTSADPSAVATCLAYNPSGPRGSSATTTQIAGATYAVLHSSDAGAGNFYDTTSYRISRNSQCYAVEYTIHYANIKNFPRGTVQQFDEKALAVTLDSIARSFSFTNGL